MRSLSTLVIMARYPTPGRVKTRLAADIGAVRACELYDAFLHDLDDRFAAGARDVVWCFEPAESNFAACVRTGRCVPQIGADLGARMLNAFRSLCGSERHAVIMIGADVPHIDDAQLVEAEAALEQADLVLGPAADGGYYLIAMRVPHDVFSGIVMGRPTVMRETLACAERRGLCVHLLPAFFDIDEPGDLDRLRRLLDSDEARARQLMHTRRVIGG